MKIISLLITFIFSFESIGYSAYHVVYKTNLMPPVGANLGRANEAGQVLEESNSPDPFVYEASDDDILAAVNRALEPKGFRMGKYDDFDNPTVNINRNSHLKFFLLSKLTAEVILSNRYVPLTGFLEYAKQRPELMLEEMPASVVKRAVENGDIVLPMRIEDGKIIVTPGSISIKGKQINIGVDDEILDSKCSYNGTLIIISSGEFNPEWYKDYSSDADKLHHAKYSLMAEIAYALALQKGFLYGDAHLESEYVRNSLWRNWSVVGDGIEPSPIPQPEVLEGWEMRNSVDLGALPPGSLVYLGGTGTWVEYIIRIEPDSTLKLWLSGRDGCYQAAIKELNGGKLKANEGISFPYFVSDDTGRLVGFERRKGGQTDWSQSFKFFRVLELSGAFGSSFPEFSPKNGVVDIIPNGTREYI